MKTIVVYQSKTGFTKEYAEKIAEELNCDLNNIKGVTQELINQYDRVIYGGWVMGSMIVDLQKIQAFQPKELVVFAVGSSMKEEGLLTAIKDANHLEQELFYMQGGFRFEKLALPLRLMLKMIRKSVAKKENPTEQDLFMEKALGGNCDYSDISFIKPLVAFCK